MNKYLSIALITFSCAVGRAQSITNLGKVTIGSALTWDNNPASENITGYFVYVRNPNTANPLYRVGVNTNRITAPLLSTNYLGDRWVHVTAVNAQGIESLPSATYNITFVNTNMTPPTNIQLFMYIVATNMIPLQAVPSLP